MRRGRAWTAQTFGEPADVLEIDEASWGDPAPGTILVEVEACGVGLPDLFMTRGVYPIVTAPPVNPGQEVSGRVISVPEGSGFAVGDRVMGLTIYGDGWWRGGLADYAFVQEKKCLHVPDNMSAEAAAGFTICFRTAHAALVERVPVISGSTVLVLGGAGSSGAAAIQLAKARGATVIAIAGSDEKLSFCREQGADFALSYRTPAWQDKVIEITKGAGVDVIFDPVGGEAAANAVKAIGRNGRIALIGFASGSWLDLNTQDMVLRNYSAIGVFSGGFSSDEEAVAYTELAKLGASGAVRTPLGKVFEFEDAMSAIESLNAPSAGKTVVRVKS
ncbi:NADPH:quinone oxidoreductase family protein [Hyphomonas chukchiensis]|uniref:NADPH:quinone oxidoreductase family protein n=1 Tax=Hyphomonas chukchiensis TaxID=1280947 RepID=UPI0009E0439A|nr:NADPH:quinone oxidoreductase family protein [Hyphomonas chukchiensis]